METITAPTITNVTDQAAAAASSTKEDELNILRTQLDQAAHLGMELYEQTMESQARAQCAEEERDDLLTFCNKLRTELDQIHNERNRLSRKNILLDECLNELEIDHSHLKE